MRIWKEKTDKYVIKSKIDCDEKYSLMSDQNTL